MLRALMAGVCGMLALAGAARAEEGSAGDTPGIEVGRGDADVSGALLPGQGFLLPGQIILHPMVGIEIGYDTNLFYEEAAPTSSGVVQVTTGANASNVRAAPRLSLWGGLMLRLRQYTTPISDGGRALSANGQAGTQWRASMRLTLGVTERFDRTQEPGYTRLSPQITSNRNNVGVQARYVLGGERLALTGEYGHSIVFYDERPYSDAGSQSHTFSERIAWRLRPTLVPFLTFTQQFNRYLRNDQSLRDSDTLTVAGGVSWRGSARFGVTASAGWYRGGFEGSDEDLQGVMGEVRAVLALGYRGNASLHYARTYESAIFSDYRSTDTVTLLWEQVLGARAGLRVGGNYARRAYGPPPPDAAGELFSNVRRVEHSVGANARLEVALRPWINATAQARVLANVSDYEYTVIRDGQAERHNVNFVRAELLAGITAEY